MATSLDIQEIDCIRFYSIIEHLEQIFNSTLRTFVLNHIQFLTAANSGGILCEESNFLSDSKQSFFA